MAHPGGTSARAQRLIGLAATGLLAVTTALAFARVFLGARATVVLLATAIASAAIAVAFERRSLLLATAASAAGAAVSVGLTVFPDTTWYGVPTAHTLSAALQAAGVVGEQARIQIAPAEPIAPLLLAAVVSLWAAIFSAHALAFRAGSPLLGLIPPVALVAFADTVLEPFVQPMYGLAFLAAALLVVFADGLSRVQGWGPVWTSSRRGVAATAGRGARRVAATALAAGLIAPVVIPGFGSRAVIDFSTTADPSAISVDPFVSVQSELRLGAQVRVMRVDGPEPMYIRLLSLPIYDGTGWRPDTSRTGVPLDPDGAVPTVEGAYGDAQQVRVEILNDFAMPWLPSSYPMRDVSIDRIVTYDTFTGTAALSDPLDEGDRFTFTAAPVAVTADELRAIDRQPGLGEPMEGAPYLAVPEDLPDEVGATALRWTRDARNPFDQAMAIQERLRSDFEYDPDASLGSGPNTIVTFLNGARAGFCQQFAATMALMLRTLNIRSRVVVGYASGPDRKVPGGWTVRSDQAHAWVEAFFPGYGWMPFEPTPTRTNPVVLGYTFSTGPDEDPGPGEDPGPARAGDHAKQQGERFNEPVPLGPACGPRQGCTTTEPLPGSTPSAISGRRGALLLLGLAVLGLALVPVGRALRRRLRIRGAAAEPRRLILATYDVFTEQVAGVGLGRAPGETLEEHRRRVLDTGYLSDGQLDRLTRVVSAAAYSSREPAAEDTREATVAAATAVAEIRRAVGPVRWVTGLYRRS